MGQTKRNCHQVPRQPKQFRLSGTHPDWEMHPDWILGIEHLDAYNHWVCEIVLPIAFQWIEEHKTEVYENIPEDVKDDLGLVISKAFDIVVNLESYQKGLEEFGKYQTELDNMTFDPSTTNPIWSSLINELRAARLSVKGKYSTKYGDSIKEHQIE